MALHSPSRIHQQSARLPFARTPALTAWLSALLFLSAAAIEVWLRPAIPIGETRYLTVTWNMWLTEDHVVPHLDGLPYGHKPPLIFYVIEEFWDVFGPLESVARLVPPLLTAGCFLLIVVAARLLWPERREIAAYAPLVLLSFVIFTIFGQTLMFDGTITLWVLTGIIGLLMTAHGRVTAGILLLGLGTGLGLLTKGPVVLVFILPPALLFPLWRGPELACESLQEWYAQMAAGVFLGSVIAIIWAVSAIGSTGIDFAVEILWHQTIDRAVSSFAHQKTWWFYIAGLPVIVFPWFFWSGLWSANRWRKLTGEWQTRFLLVSLGAALLIMTLVSAKRFNYLLPLYPVMALLISRFLTDIGTTERSQMFAWIPLALIAFATAAVSMGFGEEYLPEYVRGGLAPWLGIVLLFLAGLHWSAQRFATPRHVAACAILTVCLVVLTMAGTARIVQRYDPGNVTAAIPNVATIPLAIFGQHHGEFGFAGRRVNPVKSLYSAEALRDWAKANPGGYIIARVDRTREEAKEPPGQIVPFRHFNFGVWKADRF